MDERGFAARKFLRRRLLDQEVSRWCEQVVAKPGRASSAPMLEELCDPLHCEIDGLTSKGMHRATAFLRATEAMGEVGALGQQLKVGLQPQYSSRKLVGFMLVYLLITLAAVSAITFGFAGTPYHEALFAALYLIWVPTLYLMPLGRAAMRAECRMFGRMFRRLRGA